MAMSDTDGAFTITSLPPGDYLIGTVDTDYARVWRMPEELSRLAPLARPITVAAAQHYVVDPPSLTPEVPPLVTPAPAVPR